MRANDLLLILQLSQLCNVYSQLAPSNLFNLLLCIFSNLDMHDPFGDYEMTKKILQKLSDNYCQENKVIFKISMKGNVSIKVQLRMQSVKIC